MSILELKVKELEKLLIQQDTYFSFKIGQEKNNIEDIKFTFQYAREQLDKYFDKLFQLDDLLMQTLNKVPDAYSHLSEIKLTYNEMLEKYKELRQVYYEGEQGVFDNVVKGSLNSNIYYAQIKVPIPVNDVRRLVGHIYNLLEVIKKEAQELFKFSQSIQESKEQNSLKWEMAYLANLSNQYMKIWADLFNNKEFWTKTNENQINEPKEQDYVKQNLPEVPVKTIQEVSDWKVGNSVNVATGFFTDPFVIKKIYPAGTYSVHKTYWLYYPKNDKNYLFDPYLGIHKFDPETQQKRNKRVI